MEGLIRGDIPRLRGGKDAMLQEEATTTTKPTTNPTTTPTTLTTLTICASNILGGNSDNSNIPIGTRVRQSYSEYSAVSQSDDSTRNDGSSPPMSPSPAESPVPFLSIAEKTFTPISMDSSDLEMAASGVGVGGDKIEMDLDDKIRVGRYRRGEGLKEGVEAQKEEAYTVNIQNRRRQQQKQTPDTTSQSAAPPTISTTTTASLSLTPQSPAKTTIPFVGPVLSVPSSLPSSAPKADFDPTKKQNTTQTEILDGDSTIRAPRPRRNLGQSPTRRTLPQLFQRSQPCFPGEDTCSSAVVSTLNAPAQTTREQLEHEQDRQISAPTQEKTILGATTDARQLRRPVLLRPLRTPVSPVPVSKPSSPTSSSFYDSASSPNRSPNRSPNSSKHLHLYQPHPLPSAYSPASPISPRTRIYHQQQLRKKEQQQTQPFPNLDDDTALNLILKPLSVSIPAPTPAPAPVAVPTTPTPTHTPIVRTASNASASLCHPTPAQNTRAGACVGNIAALEATAERLSMTSSIEVAIRDLHREQKRSDSRRSSILQASLQAPQAPAPIFADASSISSKPALSRQLSAASSIVSTNNAARYGGYSPSGYILSPNHSLTGSRLRSGSRDSRSSRNNSTNNDDEYFTGGSTYNSGYLSRTGPGKSSQRSVKSSKPSLSEIAEMEPVALTKEAMDEADRAPAYDHHMDSLNFDSALTPTMNDLDTMSRVQQRHEKDDDDMPPPPPPHQHLPRQQQRQDQQEQNQQYEKVHEQQGQHLPNPDNNHQDGDADHRPMTAASVNTFEQAQHAFGDFDGVHCPPPESVLSDPMNDHMSDHMDPVPASPRTPLARNGASQIPPLPKPEVGRPTSYFDPSSGSQMLYYPARVPAMLNLPQKLSKNTKSAAVRKERRSQVLSQVPEANRASAAWLPDPLQGHAPNTSFFPDNPETPTGPHMRSTSEVDTIKNAPGALGTPADALAALNSPVDGTASNPTLPPNIPGDAASIANSLVPPPPVDAMDARKSRRISTLPPQLRASAFFDLPSQVPTIEVKDGSATKTLDSILDASAEAPVSAFTDHAYAGKLGKEVYGREKKRKSMAPMARNKTLSNVSLNKSRMSFLGIGKKQSTDQLTTGTGTADSDRRNTIMSPNLSPNDPNNPGSQRLSGDEEDSNSNDDDDRSDKSVSEDEEDEEFAGPPTTLLAELQLRKQQQKLRTRKLNGTDGLHATLLEIDAVAEQERKQRKHKKVSLAWEEPDNASDSGDEEVPLGILYAAKAMSTNNLNEAAAEANRPMGLMEQRQMEDNEPLSHRRERLQGRNPNAAARASRLTFMGQSQSQFFPSQQQSQVAASQIADEEGDDEEPLAARKRRLKGEDGGGDNLPRARPVSMAFSSELLSQFGDKEEGDKDSKTGSPKEGDGNNRKEDNSTPAEETLGQRRRRLQTEREAGGGPQQAKRISTMGDLLAANPAHGGNVGLGLSGGRSGYMSGFNDGAGGGTGQMMDPRLEERLRLEDEARHVHGQNEKMRVMRESVQQSLPQAVNRNSTYMGLNDGHGGMGSMNTRRVGQDPRVAEQIRVEEMERLRMGGEVRMGEFRAGMPEQVPGTGAGGVRSGGFKGGVFNDAMGGLGMQQQRQQQGMLQPAQRMGGMQRHSMLAAPGGGMMGGGMGMGMGNMSMGNLGMNTMGGMGMGGMNGMNMNQMGGQMAGMNAGMPMGMGVNPGMGGMAPMGMGMPAQMQHGGAVPGNAPQEGQQMNRVEMWRQSVQ